VTLFLYPSWTQYGVSGIAKCLDAIDHRHGRVKSANIEDLSPNTIFEELCMEELIKFEAMLM